MKVLQVIPSLAARDGGPTQAVLSLSRALSAKNVECLIASTDANGQNRLPVVHETTLQYDSVPAIFFRRDWTQSFKYSRDLSRWLQSHVRDFDVVHIHAIFSHSSLAAAQACRRHKVPYILRPIGSLAPWSMSHHRLRKRILWNLGVSSMIAGASAVHYTSEEECKRSEESLGIKKGVVIPLGVETAGFENNSQNGSFSKWKPYVLILSRIHPKKGIELILESFITLKREAEFREWKLVLAGDGDADYLAKLKGQARAQNGDVVFAGWLDDDQKIDALQNAALFALTSRHENFGLAVMESLACGTPVLISKDVNTASDIEKANAGWVVNLDPASIAGALREAASDAQARKAKGQAGKAMVLRKFNWSKIADDLIRLYTRVAKS
ncbi:MAG TPA: glycosyltransferase [Acidobacteriota bacterium]|nr:glycosyltransferase [Acidobacteriota bacterium]